MLGTHTRKITPLTPGEPDQGNLTGRPPKTSRDDRGGYLYPPCLIPPLGKMGLAKNEGAVQGGKRPLSVTYPDYHRADHGTEGFSIPNVTPSRERPPRYQWSLSRRTTPSQRSQILSKTRSDFAPTNTGVFRGY